MQSPFEPQVVRQAEAPHTYGEHAAVAAAEQAPAELQPAARVATLLVHEGPLHCVVALGKLQAVVFEPLQSPPHTEPSVAQAVRAPCGAPLTAEQTPRSPLTSHAWHCPEQVESQQTPSVQKPLVQAAALAQLRPAACLGTQRPPEQNAVEMQSPFTAQLVGQAVIPHR
jgi:hypothetical protein